MSCFVSVNEINDDELMMITATSFL